MNAWDGIIIGAGAAGLMAGIAAAQRGRRVLLLEKNKKPGVKILMSGGTRCNITHDCDNRAIVTAFGTNGPFLHAPLAHFGVRQVIDFFHAEGVETKIEDTGKIFPVSNKALDVLEALVRRLKLAGGIMQTETPVSAVHKNGDLFEITTANGVFTAPRLLITTGGLSYPGCGTRGDGYGFAKTFGHTITATQPALVPITVQPAWISELKGITLDDVSMKVLDTQKALSQRRAGFLFAHFGLTGPAPLDVSKAISKHATPRSLELEVDFLPQWNDLEFDDYLQKESLANGKKQLASVLGEVLPRRLGDMALAQTQQALDRKAAGLSKPDRQALVKWVKRLRLPVAGTLGYEKAEVTTGGVNLKEVNSRDMQSKLMPNLFLAGEVLDLDGPIGGYNFQSAWSTGHLAGSQL
jgi:predicted Rossmann fold flavoprotein